MMRGSRTLTRLANIELAHLSLMASALESEAEWILLLEDDATCSDVPELAAQLSQYLPSWTTSQDPSFVNVSESFTLEELGLGRPPTPIASWGSGATIYSSDIPFTNTVCAVLYRREFLINLKRVLDSIPLYPIVPIDWKVNAALMRMVETNPLAMHRCFIIEPAPITQASMHQVPPTASRS